ncbi:hypothetical protein [Jeotgalibacillus proteolyticus]|uniref:Uncharacterized protein n=1 Tax=Jeotgalibacillus proteolyticus TaxID=2082395 RepID=A0A2S5GGX9_9BACL|nr:hypothetical protein [Jeotgalibacillus proteolyticus]PPA72161.1 hypothetical protein C4B60_01935 [Jeotgalibacillus proteolyticus]
MDVDLIWKNFIDCLSQREGIDSAHWRKVAGIPFLYVSVSDAAQGSLHYEIKRCAGKAMRGKRLHAETVSVRVSGNDHVFRHRFYVPQEKMFCCGNLCPDCIRFR